MKNTLLLLFLGAFSISTSYCQNNYAKVDATVKQLGSLDSLNIATIADTIARKFNDREQKARAIFFWIATNISHDLKAIKSNDNRKSDPVSVIQFRKANAAGYAALIQEMMSMAKIRCLSVDGLIKKSAEDINNPADDLNHSWNVVQLGTSPQEWFYVDAFNAAGFSDNKMSVFTPSFSSAYFFADRNIFNLSHFPDNMAWQLGGGGPKTKKDFYALPVIKRGAYSIGLTGPLPDKGFIKTKLKNTTNFSFSINDSATVGSITLVTGDEKRPDKPIPMNFTRSGNSVSFSHQFKKDDEYPVRILVDGVEVLEYVFEVKE